MTSKMTRDRQTAQPARTKRAEQASPLARHFTLRSLLRFAAPSIGMMIIISLYTVTDGSFIGRFAGSDALAASNIVYPVINLVLGLAIMLASGGAALVVVLEYDHVANAGHPVQRGWRRELLCHQQYGCRHAG